MTRPTPGHLLFFFVLALIVSSIPALASLARGPVISPYQASAP